MPINMATTNVIAADEPPPGAVEAGQRQNPASPPTQVADGGASEDAGIQFLCGGQMELLAKDKLWPFENETGPIERARDRTSEDESQAPIPNPCRIGGEIQKVENLGRIGHAGDNKAKTKNQADGKLQKDRHEGPHNT